jgi:dipeptidyl aminopeptidase/acylaminoacyl peptidase
VTSVEATLIPREVLFGNPERVAPRISPDGSRLAWIAPDHGVLNVWVAPVGAMERAEVVTDDRERGIRAFFWAHDNRHLLYIQDRGGDENWRLYAVDLFEGGTRDLTPFEAVQAQVLKVEKKVPDQLLVALNKDNPELHDVYRLDLPTGELTKVADNPGVVDWVVDSDFQVRGAMRPLPDGGAQLLVRDTVPVFPGGAPTPPSSATAGTPAPPAAVSSAAGEWRVILDVPSDDALNTGPVTFDQPGQRLLALSSVGANAGRLVWIDLATGATDVVAEDPIYDVGDVVLHPDTQLPQVVAFQKDRVELVVLDPEVAGDIKALQALNPGDLSIVSRDADDRLWVVAYVEDSGPVAYYLWDRGSQEATFLFHHQPALARYMLAAMEPFQFTSRDGLEIHGYLTFPPGVAREALPAVLNVHGGPWARDSWGLNPEAQWLANRGYVCIQVNYRGSTGYGKDFVNAGDKQWGARMHDDLLDAIAWVVERGWVDPDRIAIYGGSYGGYAALVGATFTPEVFRAAVDIVGPSNLKTLIESIPPYWAPLIAQFHRRVGNPETEEEFLWSRSPLSRVEQVRVPLLIAQGANDPRVKQAESEQIVAALKSNDIPYQYLLFEDEGHGFAKPDNRLRFYYEAERFLAAHLGGRAEP